MEIFQTLAQLNFKDLGIARKCNRKLNYAENWTFSSGTVTGYTIEASGERYIKVNAKIEPGYTGAPAINRKSEVVGVVVSKDQEHAYLLDVGVVFQIAHQNN